jgi:guanosine-3',5'-bis(diphosphate) 3'-pyrophosphohydrolase
MEFLLKGACFAAEKHKNQRRKDPNATPYINHPLGVAFILTQCGVTDIDVLVAAMLHDTVEDTDTTLEEITVAFNPKIASIVAEVTDDKTLPSQERKNLQVINGPGKSKEAKLVKMADKIYNLRDLQRATPIGWTNERVNEYFSWAKKVTDGLKGVNPDLENHLEEIYLSYKQQYHGK